jgi:hypothetical protein
LGCGWKLKSLKLSSFGAFGELTVTISQSQKELDFEPFLWTSVSGHSCVVWGSHPTPAFHSFPGSAETVYGDTPIFRNIYIQMPLLDPAETFSSERTPKSTPSFSSRPKTGALPQHLRRPPPAAAETPAACCCPQPSKAFLAHCRRIERERDWRNMLDVVLSLSGEYI